MAPKHRLYTPEIAETILERLADGEGLNAICRDEGMPSRGAVQHWVSSDFDGFASRYARAREAGVALLADDVLEIADDATNDWMARQSKDGTSAYEVNGEHVTRSRLRVESRKWLLSKLLPKTFGDRLDLNHSGELALKDAPDEHVQSRIAQLLGAARVVSVDGGTGET